MTECFGTYILLRNKMSGICLGDNENASDIVMKRISKTKNVLKRLYTTLKRYQKEEMFQTTEVSIIFEEANILLDKIIGLEVAIKNILKGKDEFNINFSNMQDIMAGMIRPREAISTELYNEAFEYIKKSDFRMSPDDPTTFITPEWYHKKRTTAGHVLFTAKADEFFPYKRIQMSAMQTRGL